MGSSIIWSKTPDEADLQNTPRNHKVPGLFSFCFLCVRDLLLRIVADGLAQTPQIRAEGKEKCKAKFFLSVREMMKETEKFMQKLNLKVNVAQKTRTLSVSQMQMVEIAKAMSADSWLVVMDEPTSAITDADKEKLFRVIREMKEAGMAIIYVSHRMQEIFEICDEVTVLRDGHYIATMPVAETNEQALTRLMVGRRYPSYPG